MDLSEEFWLRILITVCIAGLLLGLLAFAVWAFTRDEMEEE